MKLTIEQTNNGYILSWQEEGLERRPSLSAISETYPETLVFREQKEVIEGDEEDNKVIEKLLYRVAEFFGAPYEKYGENNLNISWNKKGHKLE